jgi:hypothetical protein
MRNYPRILKLTQLRNKLPPEVAALVAGLCEVKMVWNKLERRYGNWHVTVIAGLSRLLKTEVPQGVTHLKVEAVASAVERPHSTLKNVSSKEELFAD